MDIGSELENGNGSGRARATPDRAGSVQSRGGCCRRGRGRKATTRHEVEPHASRAIAVDGDGGKRHKQRHGWSRCRRCVAKCTIAVGVCCRIMIGGSAALIAGRRDDAAIGGHEGLHIALGRAQHNRHSASRHLSGSGHHEARRHQHAQQYTHQRNQRGDV